LGFFDQVPPPRWIHPIRIILGQLSQTAQRLGRGQPILQVGLRGIEDVIEPPQGPAITRGRALDRVSARRCGLTARHRRADELKIAGRSQTSGPVEGNGAVADVQSRPRPGNRHAEDPSLLGEMPFANEFRFPVTASKEDRSQAADRRAAERIDILHQIRDEDGLPFPSPRLVNRPKMNPGSVAKRRHDSNLLEVAAVEQPDQVDYRG